LTFFPKIGTFLWIARYGALNVTLTRTTRKEKKKKKEHKDVGGLLYEKNGVRNHTKMGFLFVIVQRDWIFKI
jgi:hypothetical protein